MKQTSCSFIWCKDRFQILLLTSLKINIKVRFHEFSPLILTSFHFKKKWRGSANLDSLLNDTVVFPLRSRVGPQFPPFSWGWQYGTKGVYSDAILDRIWTLRFCLHWCQQKLEIPRLYSKTKRKCFFYPCFWIYFFNYYFTCLKHENYVGWIRKHCFI